MVTHLKLAWNAEAEGREDSATAKSRQDVLADEARAFFLEQSSAIADLARRVDGSFGRAVQLLLATGSRVVVTGIGKSGLIGRKIAATLASTGTPSVFVHAGEAFHGDLGMITEDDSVLLLSNSGETEEIVRLLPHLRSRRIPTIAIVGRTDSTLARGVDVSLDATVRREACPNNLAPTTSTMAALAMGDALAVSLIRMRGFLAEDFARLHPGGALARRLLTRVFDVMRTSSLPFVGRDATLADCLLVIAQGRAGIAIVVQDGRLVGVVLDRDVRTAMDQRRLALDATVDQIMHPRPLSVDADASVAIAERRMREFDVDRLVVVERGGRVVGIAELGDE